MYVYILFGIPVAVLFLSMIIIKITCGRTETYYKMWHFILFRQTRRCVHIMCTIVHVCTWCA